MTYSVCQDIPIFYAERRFVSMFTSCTFSLMLSGTFNSCSLRLHFNNIHTSTLRYAKQYFSFEFVVKMSGKSHYKCDYRTFNTDQFNNGAVEVTDARNVINLQALQSSFDAYYCTRLSRNTINQAKYKKSN